MTSIHVWLWSSFGSAHCSIPHIMSWTMNIEIDLSHVAHSNPATRFCTFSRASMCLHSISWGNQDRVGIILWQAVNEQGTCIVMPFLSYSFLYIHVPSKDRCLKPWQRCQWWGHPSGRYIATPRYLYMSIHSNVTLLMAYLYVLNWWWQFAG